MMLNLHSESRHRIFRATGPGKRRIEKSRKGKEAFHYNGSEETIELIIRTLISVNQFSIYGAVAVSCKELSDDSEVAGKPAANEDSEWKIPTGLPFADPHPNAESQGNLMQDCGHKFEQLPEDHNCPNCVATPFENC